MFTGFTYNTPGCTGFNCQPVLPDAHEARARPTTTSASRPSSTAWCCRRASRGVTTIWRRRCGYVFNHPNVGPFVGASPDPAPGDEQPEQGLRRARGQGLRQRRHGRARQPARGGEGRAARRGGAPRPDHRPALRPPGGAGALHHAVRARAWARPARATAWPSAATRWSSRSTRRPRCSTSTRRTSRSRARPLLGPPFQIYTESTAVRRANLVNTFVFGTISRPGYAPATGDHRHLQPRALDRERREPRGPGGRPLAAADARRACRRRCARRSSTPSRPPPPSDPTNRARTAIYLFATSPAFNINR